MFTTIFLIKIISVICCVFKSFLITEEQNIILLQECYDINFVLQFIISDGFSNVFSLVVKVVLWRYKKYKNKI